MMNSYIKHEIYMRGWRWHIEKKIAEFVDTFLGGVVMACGLIVGLKIILWVLA